MPETQSVRIVPLRNKSGEVIAEAVVDAEDFSRISLYPWFLNNQGYARRNMTVGVGKQASVLMHRSVLGLDLYDGRKVDHINHDKLDNRKANLRVVSHAENHQNRTAGGNRVSTSRFRGVSWSKEKGKWVATCKLNQKQHYLGAFESEHEAARAAEDFRRAHMPFTTN